MRPEFRAFLERVIREEGGVQAADKAAGVPPGTFSRWTNRPGTRVRPESVIKLAQTVGRARGVTMLQLLAAAGIVPAEEATAPLPAAPALQADLASVYARLADDAAYQELLIVLRERMAAYLERHQRGGDA